MKLRGRTIDCVQPTSPPSSPDPPPARRKCKAAILHTQPENTALGGKRIRSIGRGSWTMEQLNEAIDSIEYGLLSIRKASSRFGIPLTTLRRWLSGQTEDKFGSKPKGLTKQEEEIVVSWCLQMANEGRGVTLDLLRERVGQMCLHRETCFKDGLPGKKWWRLFKNRHPELSLRSAECIEVQRVKAMSHANLDEFYSTLQSLYKEFHFDASTIWNCDESGVQAAGLRAGVRILVKKSVRSVHETIPKNREWLTVLSCVSANGYRMPGLYVFKGERMRNRDLMAGCEPGAAMAFQKKAWITNALFDAWLDHFRMNVPGGISLERPHLLICDGHGSHVTLSAIQHARQIGLHILLLPPHTSHRLQPLDVACFGPFKNAFKKLRGKYMHINRLHEPSKEDLAAMISKAIGQSLTPANIAAGFARTGIWPFNSKAVLPDPYANEVVVADSEEEEDNNDADAGNNDVDIANNVVDVAEILHNLHESLAPNDIPATMAPAAPAVIAPAVIAPAAPAVIAHAAPTAPVIAHAALAGNVPLPIAKRSKLPDALVGRLFVTSNEMIAARIEQDRLNKEAVRLRKEKLEEKKKLQADRKKARELDIIRKTNARAAKAAQKKAEKLYEETSATARAALFHNDGSGKCRYNVYELFGVAKELTEAQRQARIRAKAKLDKIKGRIVNIHNAASVFHAQEDCPPILLEHDDVPEHHIPDHAFLGGHMLQDSQDPYSDDETCIPCSREDTHQCSWDARCAVLKIINSDGSGPSNIWKDRAEDFWTEPDGFHGRNVDMDICHGKECEADASSSESEPQLKKTKCLDDVYR